MWEGNLRKMKVAADDPVSYALMLGEETVKMNELLGSKVLINFEGRINCVACGRLTKKSFGQGFCYPCFMNSPQNAECIIRPELCEAHVGHGRDPEWEETHHNQPHVVYLALTDTVKVGVTRVDQIPTRWIDQGAWKAIILAETPYRQLAGQIEVALKEHVTDKTNWRNMLKGIESDVDLLEIKEELAETLDDELIDFYSTNHQITELHYPILKPLKKTNSLNLDKNPQLGGTLTGIRGQYLMFDSLNVINLRKYSGYYIQLDKE